MFEGLAGNTDVKARLIKLVSEDRLPQSLIFAGRDGIGKRQFALEIAKSLVCSEPTDKLPCGRCAPCRRSGTFKLPTSGKKEDYTGICFSEHPDVGMIVPNKNTIYIDAIRHLSSEAFFRPYEAKSRIFIIDEAEKLGLTQKAAANALLKTLEEPAATTYIILVTSKPSSLLQTIRSRCQMIRFASVSEEEIGLFLAQKNEIPAADAELAGRIANGSVARALEINLPEYKDLREKFLRVIGESVRGGASVEAIALSDELSKLKDQNGYSDSLEILETLVRDLLLLKSGLIENLTHADIANEISQIGSMGSKEVFLRWIEEIEALKSSLRFNVNKKVAADALFVKMAGI